MNASKTQKILALSLPIQILLVTMLSRYPTIVDNYYSNGIYTYISTIFRKVLGWIPFSIGDIYYTMLGIFILYGLFKFFKGGFRKRITEKLWRFGAFTAVLYFFFYFLWGLNYHRSSLFDSFEVDEEEYGTEDLIDLSEYLIAKTKQAHSQLTSNDTLKVTITLDKKNIIQDANNGYKALSNKLPEFTYNDVSLKKSLYSLPLTYMGFSGYFNPFTGEAQVDYLVPKHSLPTIATHEIAHQLGYASESEANFIGFLAAINHPEPYYQYAGYLKAMRYAVAATYGRDSIVGKRLINSIPKGIKKNILETQDFWISYQNKAEPFFKLFYDNYLKMNNQQDGIKGYSRMVGLLVALREKYEE